MPFGCAFYLARLVRRSIAFGPYSKRLLSLLSSFNTLLPSTYHHFCVLVRRNFTQILNYFLQMPTLNRLFVADYPWKTNTQKRLQELLWLPDPYLRKFAHKLIFDFLLLICTCRQQLVFRIEKQYENSEFPGGSNKSVVDEINKLGSGEVPIDTHDFVSQQKNWLDILKCIVFLGCFWITLAIVFLTGSSHINIYSIGYLIGSFVFLWQGGEFYLRPIYTILRWWKLLVAYNVLVIAIKTFLNLPTCIFVTHLEENWNTFCFFVKVFGISCNLNADLLKPDDPSTDVSAFNSKYYSTWVQKLFWKRILI